MSVLVSLPVMLRELTGLSCSIEIAPGSVDEVLQSLKRHYPQLAMHLYDENGGLRQHLRCSVNGEIVHDLANTQLSSGDNLHLVHAVAAG